MTELNKSLGVTQTNIDNIVESLYQHLSHNGLPLPFEREDALEQIVEHFGGKIEFVPKEDGKANLIHIKEAGCFTIYLPKENGYLHNRFIIGHELGHYFLHYILKGIQEEARARMHSHIENKDTKVEKEASDFSASFLLPKKQVLQKYQELKNDSSLEENDDLGIIKHLAASFSVSIDTTRKRWSVVSRD